MMVVESHESPPGTLPAPRWLFFVCPGSCPGLTSPHALCRSPDALVPRPVAFQDVIRFLAFVGFNLLGAIFLNGFCGSLILPPKEVG